MIEIESFDSDRREILFGASTSDLVQQRVVKLRATGCGAASDHALGQHRHRLDRAAHVDDRIASDLRYHNRRVRSNSGKDYRTRTCHDEPPTHRRCPRVTLSFKNSLADTVVSQSSAPWWRETMPF